MPQNLHRDGVAKEIRGGIGIDLDMAPLHRIRHFRLNAGQVHGGALHPKHSRDRASRAVSGNQHPVPHVFMATNAFCTENTVPDGICIGLQTQLCTFIHSPLCHFAVEKTAVDDMGLGDACIKIQNRTL